MKYWAGDHMGHLDALHALLRKCKLRARQSGRSGKDDGIKAMWMERGSRVCLIIASQLVEMKVSWLPRCVYLHFTLYTGLRGGGTDAGAALHAAAGGVTGGRRCAAFCGRADISPSGPSCEGARAL